MWQSFDSVSSLSREFAEANLQSLASFSKGAQALAAETAEYGRKSVDAGGKAAQQIFAAGSLDKAIEVQLQYARQAYEDLVAETARVGELCADVAREAYKPYELVAARPR